MASIRTYDLQDRLIAFSVLVLDLIELIPDTKVGNHIAGQLLRSGTSPAPNYGEAQAAESRRDFLHKMGVCLKELRETQIHLLVIRDKGLIGMKEKLNSVLGGMRRADCNLLQEHRDGKEECFFPVLTFESITRHRALQHHVIRR